MAFLGPQTDCCDLLWHFSAHRQTAVISYGISRPTDRLLWSLVAFLGPQTECCDLLWHFSAHRPTAVISCGISRPTDRLLWSLVAFLGLQTECCDLLWHFLACRPAAVIYYGTTPSLHSRLKQSSAHYFRIPSSLSGMQILRFFKLRLSTRRSPVRS